MGKPKRRRKRKSDPDASPKPAPGSLRLVQDFLNTRDFDAQTEALSSPGEVRDWLVERGLLDAEAPLTKRDWVRARNFRAGARGLLMQSLGYEVKPETIDRLDRAIQGARPQFGFGPAGETRIAPGDFNLALGHLVALVMLSRAEGLWERFKICGNCQTAFYDYSKTRPSLWCTRRCGDRLRADRHHRASREYALEYEEWRQRKIENFTKFLGEVDPLDWELPSESSD